MTSPEADNVVYTFAANGSVHSTASPEAIGSPLFNEVDAYIAIFDAALGVNSATWYDRSVGATDDSLGKARFTAKFNDPLVPVDEIIDQLLSVSVPIVAGINKFDIFANLGIVAVNNANPIEITLDFTHTASFGIDLPPGRATLRPRACS